MTTAVERAAARVRTFAAQRHDAYRLARLASLAVRVDPPLLRALRLTLPGTDASAEADLWFSPLCESASSQGFVLNPNVSDLLRVDLADEIVDGKQRALDTAWTITERLHAHWPASLQLEERVTWLALQKDVDHVEEIERLLRQAAKAMFTDATRGLEVARWALRALSRLPRTARETEGALLLALGASERLGGRTVLAGSDRAGALLAHAAWILPSETLSRRTWIGVRLYPDCIEFVEPAKDVETVELPQTTPLYVELSWGPRAARQVHTVAAVAGRVFMLPAGAVDLRLRTLAGDEYALDGTGVSAPTMTATPTEGDDLFRACVGVRSMRGADKGQATYGVGYFVSRDVVLTNASVVGRAEDPVTTVNKPVEVYWRGERIGAAVISARRSGEAMLRLNREIRDALVLPREDSDYTLSIGMLWESVIFDGNSFREIRGTVTALAVRLTESPIRADHEGMIELRQEGAPESVAGAAGAPVVIRGKVVGQLELWSSSALYAIPVTSINQFVYDVLRPGEHDPFVFVSYAPRDDYGKGTKVDEAPAGRVKRALRAARVLPQFDTELQEGMKASAEEITSAVNAADGAAVFVTPVSHLQADVARLELLLLAYRRWVKADFPLATFQFRSSGLREKRAVPPALRQLEGPALDDASDESLESYARQAFAGLGLLRDEASGRARVQARLGALLTKARASNEVGPATGGSRSAPSVPASWTVSTAVDAVTKHGMSADIPWERWLQDLPPEEGREVVEIAAMFSVAVGTHAPLAALAASMHLPDERRAFSLNAMPINYARAVVRRAWIGQAPPRWIGFRDQQWPTLGGPDDPVKRVVDEVARALDCSDTQARITLETVTAPLVLIFATRPLPEPSYIDALKRALPHTVMFFLTGNLPDADELARTGVAALPPIEEQDWGRFLQRYKRLMEIVAPRVPNAPRQSTPARRKVAKRPKRKK